jgi:Anti-sigma-K factor rskA/Putative zinc-finger
MSEREPMSETPECGGDAAAYVLGALEPHEVEAFRAHMQECAVCRDVRHQPRAEAAAALRRPWWRRPRELFAAGAATVLASAGVVVGIELSAGVAATVITAKVSRIAGSAQLRVSNGRGELVVSHLTPPGHGHVYEVWLQRGTAAPVPASVLFGVNASGDADVGIPSRMHGISAVLVTAEPLGGTLKPTAEPVIVAKLS